MNERQTRLIGYAEIIFVLESRIRSMKTDLKQQSNIQVYYRKTNYRVWIAKKSNFWEGNL